jgi:hypothetical protein
VVQELPDRHALRDRTNVTIEGERPNVDELEDDRGYEDLGHARDPEAMIRSQALSCLEIGDSGGSLPVEARTGGQSDGARNARSNNCVEVIVKRLQKRPRYPGKGSGS